jgi:hypothetical protein
MTLEHLLPTVVVGLLVAGLYGCGTPDARPDASQAAGTKDTAAAEGAPADAPPAADPGQQPLTVADIDRWERGMAAELEAVRAGAAKRKAAKTADDTVSAMMPSRTRPRSKPGPRPPAWMASATT